MSSEKEKDNENKTVDCDGIGSAVESLIDSSTLAAAIAEPEEFAEDYCDEKRVEQRRPKVKHKATCKEKTAVCMKKTCVYMLSYVGLTCIVVAYSIGGGFLFCSLEEAHEVAVEQEAVKLRITTSKDLIGHYKTHSIDFLQTRLNGVLKEVNENTSIILKEDIENGVSDMKKDMKKQLKSIMTEIFMFNQSEKNFAQKQNQNKSTILKSKENEIVEVLDVLGKLLVENTIKSIKSRLSEAKSSFSSLVANDVSAVDSNGIISLLKTFQKNTYDLVSQDGWNGVDPDDSEDSKKWTYAGGLLYAVTVITTIGYGTITPKTDAGKAVTIFYALIGIPLTVLCITNIGRGMASLCRAIYSGTCCVECRQQFFSSFKTRRLSSIVADNIELDKLDRENVSEVEIVIHKHGEVPIFLSLILVTWYIIFGAVMFQLWEEDWSFFEGAYFCFITLSTIGFGDFVPGFKDKDWDSQIKQIACSFYLLIGLATLAMCFDLIQQRGYGTITPKTDAGKAVTIFYALIGIPLTVLCITNIGRGMASLCRAIYSGTCCVECRQQFFSSFKTRRLSSIVADNIELDKLDRENVSEVEIVIHKHGEVPIFLSLILVTWYIIFGAVMFQLWEEDWSFFEGAYFCFITLSTIGFGDFVPGFKDKDWDSQIKQIACSFYLLIGLATLAMCFDLIQQRGKAIANNFAFYIGLVKREDESKDASRISV